MDDLGRTHEGGNKKGTSDKGHSNHILHVYTDTIECTCAGKLYNVFEVQRERAYQHIQRPRICSNCATIGPQHFSISSYSTVTGGEQQSFENIISVVIE